MICLKIVISYLMTLPLDYVYRDYNDDELKRNALEFKRESEDEFKTIIDKTFQTLYYDKETFD